MKRAVRVGFIFAILLCLASSSRGQSDSDYVVVASKDVLGTSINLSNLKGIYLREIRYWRDGGEIVAVDLTDAGGFYQNLFGKTYMQMRAYWLNMMIKHNMALPVSKKDPESVKQFIAENKGAIGFLKHRDLDDRVKVLKIIE